jgi:peptide deformylase
LWQRRKFLKAGFFGFTAIAGVLVLLKRFHANSDSPPPVLTYPNPILRSIAGPVTVIDDSVVSLAQQMIAILRARSFIDFFLKGSLCKGLSAPQIGVQKRVTVCGLNGELKVLVNPEILMKKGVYENTEYCLSLPRHPTRNVVRSGYIKVRYRNLRNEENVLVATKQSAGLLEHEIDHLNGVLYIDYQDPMNIERRTSNIEF